MRSSIIPIFIPHLGCPNNCVFCDQRQIASAEAPSADRVREIIDKALEYAVRPQISFYGGSFTAIGNELMESYLKAAWPYVEDGRCDSIRLSTRPDAIDPERLEILKKYGVRTIELGTQSMADHVLTASGRGHDAEATRRASALIHEYGFELILQMMVGLPGASIEDELYTAREICALRPTGVRIYPTCVIGGTPLYEMYKRGIYKDLSIYEAVDICADLLDIFEEKGIKVVRLGLNPTEELSGGAVKAGAYHPALGEMVYSRRFLKDILKKAPNVPYEILVPPRMLSIAIGQKKCNLEYLKNTTSLAAIKARKGIEEPEIRII